MIYNVHTNSRYIVYCLLAFCPYLVSLVTTRILLTNGSEKVDVEATCFLVRCVCVVCELL